ncbi:Wzz/FepE/Etk N-terminal domain-containing protein [Nocardioides sp. YIM 152588]|uniref:Wzz/FepE/Etk N-terminal domain-containing protein n=1 Tax=Nocardioides sp. YIM 152588 TaxID=3158259 RepID=UPI0032E4E828
MGIRSVLRQSRWLVVGLTVAGALLGIVAAAVVGEAPPRYLATATLAMTPAEGTRPAEIGGRWEVLSGGQATRTAAAVLGQQTWLDEAASRAGTEAADLGLEAGAVPDTTLITMRLTAGGEEAAATALASVIDQASDQAASVSGPFALVVVEEPSSTELASLAGGWQRTFVLTLAGGLVGYGLGLALTRLLARRGPAPSYDVP